MLEPAHSCHHDSFMGRKYSAMSRSPTTASGHHLKCWPDLAGLLAGRVIITYSILIIIEYVSIW